MPVIYKNQKRRKANTSKKNKKSKQKNKNVHKNNKHKMKEVLKNTWDLPPGADSFILWKS